MRIPIATVFLAWARRLRFRQLFYLTAVLFLLDLVIPDMLPFADEVLLGLATLLFASWKDSRSTDLSDKELADLEADRPGKDSAV